MTDITVARRLVAVITNNDGGRGERLVSAWIVEAFLEAGASGGASERKRP